VLTAVVLTRNEAAKLPECLSSLKFCDRVVVVDDHSVDNTAAIARKFGAEVLVHPLADDFSAQRNWAQDHIKSPWLLYVDADEQVSPPAAQSIRKAVSAPHSPLGFYLRRRDSLWGHTLTHGDVGEVWLLRLARRGAGQWQGRVHETWAVIGPTNRLSGDLLHTPHNNLADFLVNINYYSTLKAREFFEAGHSANLAKITLGPWWRFFKHYVLKLGFLDGPPGFIHAMTMAFYTFLVGGKLYLLTKGIPHE